MTFDPRTISKSVYEALQGLREQQEQNKERLKDQKNQAVELYTYLSTWGMMRLKAEEKQLEKQLGKQEVIQKYFECLQQLSDLESFEGLQQLSGEKKLTGNNGLNVLKTLETDEYLGITGLGLALAQEFSFWANTIYWDIKGEQTNGI